MNPIKTIQAHLFNLNFASDILSRGNMSHVQFLSKSLDFAQLMSLLQMTLVSYILLPLNNADSLAARIFFKRRGST